MKILTCVAHCSQIEDDCVHIPGFVPGYTYCVSVLALDAVGVVQIFIYYYVYASLKFLRESMDDINMDLFNVRKKFDMIADCCDNISALYGKMVSVHVLYEIC